MGRGKHTPNDIRLQGDIAYIILTDHAGNVRAETMIDVADLPRIRAYPHRWSAVWHARCQSYRAFTKESRGDGKQRNVQLSVFLLRPLPGFDVDHINHDTLDNRRSNLRVCTRTENARNYRPGAYESRRKSGVGSGPPVPQGEVWFDGVKHKWRARFTSGGKRHYCGYHATREAAVARLELERAG